MLQGKIVQDQGSYVVKMGGVTINITDDVCDLIAQERARSAEIIEQERTRLRAVIDRYNQIASIILANHNPGPVGDQGGGPCQWTPTG
jgi:hypothetical protein